MSSQVCVMAAVVSVGSPDLVLVECLWSMELFQLLYRSVMMNLTISATDLKPAVGAIVQADCSM